MRAFLLYVATALVPLTAHGQSATEEVNRVFGLFRTILDSFQVLVLIAVTLAFFFFFWNIAAFIRTRGQNSEKTAEAKERLLWSVIAIFILVSIWGIVFFLYRVFIGDPENLNRDPSKAVDGGLPIESLRLPIDPKTSETDSGTQRDSDFGNDEEYDFGNPRDSDTMTDDDNLGTTGYDSSWIDTGSWTGTPTVGEKISIIATVEQQGDRWIAREQPATGNDRLYVIKTVTLGTATHTSDVGGFNRFIRNNDLKDPVRGKPYKFTVETRSSQGGVQTFEVKKIGKHRWK